MTSKIPSEMLNKETSKVPPPKSKTKTVESDLAEDFLPSNPYAMAAAVGSLIIRNTSRPAISPASCKQSKTIHDIGKPLSCTIEAAR